MLNLKHTNGLTNLNASGYQSSEELNRNWCEAKDVNNAQLAKIEEVDFIQKLMSEVHKRLDYHYMFRNTSKEVIRV